MSAGFISELGDGACVIFLGLAVYARTGDVLGLGLMWAVKAVARIAFQPFAGALADRFERRSLLVLSSLACAVSSVAIAVSLAAPLWCALAAIGLLQVCNTVFGPASAAIMPALFGADDLQRANGLYGAAMNVADIAGPALGGLSYAAVGAAGALWVFCANAITFVILAWALSRLPVMKVAARAGTRLWHSVRAGASYARKSHLILGMLLLAVVDSLVWRAVEIVLVPLSLGALRVGSGGLGLGYSLLTVGALAGALLAGRAGRILDRPGVLLICYSALGLPLIALSLLAGPSAFYACMFGCGLVLDLFGVSVRTLLQRRVDNEYLGRIFSLQGTCSAAGALPLAFGIAPLTSLAGELGVLLWAGLLLLVSGLAIGSAVLMLEGRATA